MSSAMRPALAIAFGVLLLAPCAATADSGGPTCADEERCTRAELEAHERLVAHHLLRAQQLRFEAKQRQDPEAKQRKLTRECDRTAARWRSAKRSVDELQHEE